MKKPSTIKEVIRISYRIQSLDEFVINKFSEEKEVPFTRLNLYHKYSLKNGVFAFYKHSCLYVIPYFNGLEEIFEKGGFVKSDFFESLSNLEESLNDSKWEITKNICRHLNNENIYKDVTTYCSGNGITNLLPDILSNSLEIPIEGLDIIYNGVKSTEYPLVLLSTLNTDIFKKFGCYNINNGIVVIHSDKGRTYISKSTCDLVQKLDRSGYKRNWTLWVPLSNGEKILNEHALATFKRACCA